MLEINRFFQSNKADVSGSPALGDLHRLTATLMSQIRYSHLLVYTTQHLPAI